MKFDIDAIVGVDNPERKLRVEAAIQTYEKAAKEAWQGQLQYKILTIAEILFLVLSIVLAFIPVDWTELAIMGALALAVVAGIIAYYKKNDYIKTYVTEKIKQEFAEC